MGLSHSPSIVMNGLVINIDPGNTRSYAGTGNTVTNIAFLGSTVSSKTAGVGVSVYASSPSTFSASGGNYINTNYTLSSGTAFTISMWFKRTSSSFWTVLFGNEIWFSSQGFAARLESATSIRFSAGGDFVGLLYDNAALVSGNFNHYTFVKNASGTDSFIYLNGVRVANGSITNATISKTLLINSRYSNDGASAGTDSQPGEFSTVLVYERALSVQEVLQNYNATKARFGR
jgi:hypothetical protein